jgi:hypothetical protein
VSSHSSSGRTASQASQFRLLGRTSVLVMFPK